MSTIIAESYNLELKAWLKLIGFYKDQLDGLKHKLFQAFKVPVLIRDGARLETYQVHISALQDFFYDVEEAIEQQLTQIDKRYLFDDIRKNEAIEHQQLLLRYRIASIEKKYLIFRSTLAQYLISIFEVVVLAKLNSHLPKLRPMGHRSANITI